MNSPRLNRLYDVSQKEQKEEDPPIYVPTFNPGDKVKIKIDESNESEVMTVVSCSLVLERDGKTISTSYENVRHCPPEEVVEDDIQRQEKALLALKAKLRLVKKDEFFCGSTD